MENIVQDHLGHELYGTFAALNAFAFLFIVLVDLGINQYLTRELSSSQKIAPETLSYYFSLKLLLAVVYPLFLLGAGALLSYSLHELAVLLLISLSYSAYQIILYFRAKFQASQLFNLDTVSSVLDKVFLIILTGVLLVSGLSIYTYAGIRLTAMLLGCLVIGVIAYRKYQSASFRLRWNHVQWKAILRQTYPFAFITILFSLHDKIDQVMIERMLGQYASGMYAAAYRWVDAFMMYLWVVLPIFFARFANVKGNKEELSKMVSVSQVVSGLPVMLISTYVWFYGDTLFFLLGNSTPAEIVIMTECLNILFISVMIHAYFAAFGTLLSSTGGEFFINRMLIFSILLNVLLNMVLLPLMGIAGAAWATVASTLVLSLSYLYFIRKKDHVLINQSVTFKLILTGAGLAVCFYVLNYFGVQWWLAAVAGGIFLALSSLASGLLQFVRKG